jgi:hypothetical protein
VENKETGQIVGEPIPGEYKKFIDRIRYSVFKAVAVALFIMPAAGLLVYMFLHHHRFYEHWLILLFLILGIALYFYSIPTVATKMADWMAGKPEDENEKTGT